MIDIHTHILPCIDDGSGSMDHSILMVEEAIRCGITDIIATPHYCPKRGYNHSVEEIQNCFDELESEIKKRNLPVRMYLGEEIYCSEYDDVLSKLKKKELLTLNNSSYVLLEFSFKKMPENIFDLFYSMTLNGYKPIVAHIERYEWMTVEIADRMKEEGCLLQVNATSFRDIRKIFLCKKLRKNGLIDIIASDNHFGRKECYKNYKDLFEQKMINLGKNIIDG